MRASVFPTLFAGLLAAPGFTACLATESNRADGPALRRGRERLREVPRIDPRKSTPRRHAYDDAPRTPDADDPAIWIHPDDPEKSLVIGTLKDAGLEVYDLDGDVIQTISPPNRPAISRLDPRAPGPRAEAATSACPGSADGTDFGRFNNVSVTYDFPLFARDGDEEEVDLAVVTDRGCDRLRVYAIDPDDPSTPLREISAPELGRVFPERFVQPSSLQPSDMPLGRQPNPLAAQNTAYGLALARLDGRLHAFVAQRNRSVIAEPELRPTHEGTVESRRVREFRFPTTFALARDDAADSVLWTPCREEPADDPGFEGLVVDEVNGVLFASQEVIGLWRVPLSEELPPIVNVSATELFERVVSFGQAYAAVPTGDGTFECSPAPEGAPAPGAIVTNGVASAAGRFLVADVEGLAVFEDEGERYLVASSQGDDTFHVFRSEARAARGAHVAAFQIDGVEETDGLELATVPLGDTFPGGLLVVQNGGARGPRDTSSIAGYDYDGSTQFRLVHWADVLDALRWPGSNSAIARP